MNQEEKDLFHEDDFVYNLARASHFMKRAIVNCKCESIKDNLLRIKHELLIETCQYRLTEIENHKRRN